MGTKSTGDQDCSPCSRRNNAVEILIALRTSMSTVTLLLAILSVECSVVQPPAADQPSSKLMVSVAGITPGWDLNEMVRCSDVVIRWNP